VSRPSLAYRAVALASRPLFDGLFRLEARGAENLPESGFVLAANHVSNFDPWPLGLPLLPDRYLRFMAKSELFWWPLGPFIASAGAFKVHRGRSDAAAMETAMQLARDGEIVVMFPEGTRQKKGMRKKFEARPHTGAARIALGAGVPLVPAAIKGMDNLARAEKLRVVYGAPIDVSDLDGLDPREAAQTATDRLMAEIHRLYATL
jgi:1-acyl-sn-glycerol-3-phosphate acyltransferase